MRHRDLLSSIESFQQSIQLLSLSIKSKDILEKSVLVSQILSYNIADVNEEQIELLFNNTSKEIFNKLLKTYNITPNTSEITERYVENVNRLTEVIKEEGEILHGTVFPTFDSKESSIMVKLCCSYLEIYHSLLISIIEPICEKETLLEDVNTFKLYISLQQLEKWIFQNIPPTKFHPSLLSQKSTRISSIFYGVFIRYLQNVHQQITSLVSSQSNDDLLTPISDHQLHSSSVIKLFDFCSKSYQFLLSTQIEDPTFYSQFAEILSDMVTQYLNHLINDRIKVTTNITQPFKTTKEYCIILNNFDYTNTQFNIWMKKIEDDIVKLEGGNNLQNSASLRSSRYSTDNSAIKFECIINSLKYCIKSSSDDLKLRRNQVISLIADGISNSIYLQLSELTKKNVMNTDKLFAYLDSQIEVLYENLYTHLFQKSLKTIWSSLVDMLSKFLHPNSPNVEFLSMESIILLRKYFEEFQMYFSEEGIQEIPISYINRKSLFFTSMMQLCDQTTRQLIDLYNQNKQGQYLNQNIIFQILQLRSQFGDNESSLFVEKQKEFHNNNTPDLNNNTNNNSNYSLNELDTTSTGNKVRHYLRTIS